MDFGEVFSEVDWKKLVVSLVVGFILSYFFVAIVRGFTVYTFIYLLLYWSTIISAYLLYRLSTFKQIFGAALMVISLMIFIPFPIFQEIYSLNYQSDIYSNLYERNATSEEIDAFTSMPVPSIFNFGVIVEDLVALVIGIILLISGYYLQADKRMKKAK